MRNTFQASLASLLAAGALWVSPGAAHASTVYAFSFNNVQGAVAGTVSGTLTLGDGNGTFAATAITIDAGPAGLGFSFPVLGLGGFTAVISNSFTVSGGSIDVSSVDFLAVVNPTTAFGLSSNIAGATFLDKFGSATNGAAGVRDQFSSTLSFAAPADTAAVPEPASLALVAVALAGLAAAGRRSPRSRRSSRLAG
jgi:hypothetical protein